MPSFDIVSEVEMTEAKNAVDNSNRELDTRYDFRGVEASFEFAKEIITMKADSDFQLNQMFDILAAKAVKRGLDVKSFELKDVVHTGKTYSQQVIIKQGIEKDISKKIIKLIKDSKVKVQSAIQGEEVRVTGKKRDDLQAIMQLVREADLGQPFQFKNFRD
ncbi:YajQ family cyclic di-GMP-binding protein [Pseudoalteromonas sp. SSM20]|uniref:YajQ family cyclic di-GMP-binding protein n=1 Tax=Pseudoalteromonas sp. SSM20 TaxID=3139394 RepID=UPI003BAB61ED